MEGGGDGDGGWQMEIAEGHSQWAWAGPVWAEASEKTHRDRL